MDDCVFCKIVAGEIPVPKEYEDESLVVFKSNKPDAPVHVLLVPKRHIESIKVVSDQDVDILGKIQVMARKMAEKLGIANGYKLALNAGRFQEVMHIHYHLLGGFAEGGEK